MSLHYYRRSLDWWMMNKFTQSQIRKFLKPNYSRITKKWKPLSWPNLFLSKPLKSSLSEWRKKWQKCKKLTVFSSILKILLQTLSVRVTKQFLISDKYLSVLSLQSDWRKTKPKTAFSENEWLIFKKAILSSISI